MGRGAERSRLAVLVARRAIENLFSDTSVPLRETLADLEDLRDDIDLKIDALRWDVERDTAAG